MTGFASYLRLEIGRTVRNGRYLMFTVGFPLAFYLLFSALYGNQASGQGFDFNTFYMVSMATYGAFGAAMNANGPRLAVERAGGWSRQLRVTPLPPAAYVVAKTVTAIVVAIPSVTLVTLAGVLVHHAHMSAASWVAYLVGAWFGVLPFAVLGVLLGYLFDSESANGAGMLIYFALAIFGGMWFPVQVMPKLMRDIAYVVPTYHYASLGWNAVSGQWLGWGHIAVLLAYTVGFGLLAMWRYRRDEAREYA